MMLIDTIKLDDIYRFMETGNPDNAPSGIVDYLELLTRVDGMIRRINVFGSEQLVVKHLVLIEKLSPIKAKEIYYEAIEYFYSDKTVSMDSWRNFYAQVIEGEMNYVRATKKDSADSKRAAELAKMAFDIRGGNKVEIEKIPKEMYVKPFVVYTTNIEDLGLPRADRNKIKALIENKVPQLTEKEKHRLFQEADIIPFITFQNEQENPRKA